ncbi:MAG: hypothetical protein AB1730_22285 [Myxococcota bacterium]
MLQRKSHCWLWQTGIALGGAWHGVHIESQVLTSVSRPQASPQRW